MSVRRFTRIRREFSGLERLDHALRRRTGFLLGLVFITTGATLCYSVPMAWMNRRLREVAEPFAYRAYEQLQRVEGRWNAPIEVPVFQTGTEPKVVEWLKSDPQLVLVQDSGRKERWVRQGDHLMPADVRTIPVEWRQCLKEAASMGGFSWTPPARTFPNTSGTAVVIQDRGWVGLRVWRIGSPETEAFLRQSLPPNPLIRVGLRRSNNAERPDFAPTEPWNTPPNLQAAFDRQMSPKLDLKGGQKAFGEGWEIAALPSPDQEAILKTLFLRSRNEALVLVGGILLMWTLVFWVQRRARLRERADMDRLASLAHSLKTPLSVLKLRCDTLRLGKLGVEQAEAQFLHLGEEVELLAQVIEHGLRGLRRNEQRGHQEEASEGWFRSVADELWPAFEADGRSLELKLAEGSGRAHLPSLRTALVTLLENALLHGRGPVLFHTVPGAGRMNIQVINEAPDLDPTHLSDLGRPFFRPRSPRSEGFRSPGNGLGLFLLHQTAEREGWGFSLTLTRDSVLFASLEIPT